MVLDNTHKILYFVLFVIVLLLFGQYTLIDIRRKRKLEFDRLEKEKEKELNAAKLQFFTNISHELRSRRLRLYLDL